MSHVISQLPTLSLGISLSSDPCFKNTFPVKYIKENSTKAFDAITESLVCDIIRSEYENEYKYDFLLSMNY